MTDQEADDLLANNDWSSWDDARWLVKHAVSTGASKQIAENISDQKLLEWLKNNLGWNGSGYVLSEQSVQNANAEQKKFLNNCQN